MLETLFNVFLENIFFVSFFGSIFFGESVMITVATLATIHSLNIFLIFFLCFLGVYIADYIWFTIGKTKFLYKMPFIGKIIKRHPIPYQIKKFIFLRPIVSLSLVKITYGIRIATILYLGHNHKKKWSFLKFNVIPCIIGIIPSFILGILIGKGLQSYVLYVDNIRRVMGLILLGVIISIIIIKVVEKKWSKYQLKKKFR